MRLTRILTKNPALLRTGLAKLLKLKVAKLTVKCQILGVLLGCDNRNLNHRQPLYR